MSSQLGIFGDGQLARMLSLACHQRGIEPTVFGEYDSPAGLVTPDCRPFKKSWLLQDLHEFTGLTFESEFIDTELFQSLPPSIKTKFFPRLDVLAALQKRHLQKELLFKHGLPTLPYVPIASFSHWLSWKNQNKIAAKKSWVGKKNFGGYDGYGTFFLTQDQKRFQTELKKMTTPQEVTFILEPKVSFRRELALTAARDRNNQVLFLPLVQTVQHEGQCRFCFGPIQHSKLASLQLKIKKFLDLLDYVGVLTFELFEIEGELVINEIAPRVHNSAHYSQTALDISQFELHVLCGLGLELPKRVQQLAPYFAMINLVGRKKKLAQPPQAFASHLHWYGKLDERPQRKLGHVNLLSAKAFSVSTLARIEKGILL